MILRDLDTSKLHPFDRIMVHVIRFIEVLSVGVVISLVVFMAKHF